MTPITSINNNHHSSSNDMRISTRVCVFVCVHVHMGRCNVICVEEVKVDLCLYCKFASHTFTAHLHFHPPPNNLHTYQHQCLVYITVMQSTERSRRLQHSRQQLQTQKKKRWWRWWRRCWYSTAYQHLHPPLLLLRHRRLKPSVHLLHLREAGLELDSQTLVPGWSGKWSSRPLGRTLRQAPFAETTGSR